MYISISLSLSIYIYIYIYTYLPIYLSTYLPIYLSTYLSILHTGPRAPPSGLRQAGANERDFRSATRRRGPSPPWPCLGTVSKQLKHNKQRTRANKITKTT